MGFLIRRAFCFTAFSLSLQFTVEVHVVNGQEPQRGDRVYVLRPREKSVVIPDKMLGIPVVVIDNIPEAPKETLRDIEPDALRAELSLPQDLQLTPTDQRAVAELNRKMKMIRMASTGAASTSDCSDHEVIGTVLPGTPLNPTDTVGTWVSMPIAEHGIQGLSGTLFATFSNIAAQTLEVIGNYGTGNQALLSVYDWSCVDGKQGSPNCDANSAWVYGKNQIDVPSRYKFYYWDCCKWVQAFALANKSRYVHLTKPLPPFLQQTFYLNEAKILNWHTLKWETFYSRSFQGRDAQPPRPWGPIASLEFVSASGCPTIPRLGFREVRYLPAGGVWTLAIPANTSMRFDLANDYRYCLFDPNHTWCACLK